MDVAALADLVGVESYRLASEWAHRTATSEGAHAWPDEAADPHELSAIVWDHWDGASLRERLELALALYRDIPCYANLMYVNDKFHRFGEDERRLLWEEYRALLAQPDDALAAPVTYSLAVDYYEDGSVADEAWAETTSFEPPYERRLERVLTMASAQAPWDLKAALYEQLIGEPGWHVPIFRSLLDSAEEVTGDIDRKDAEGVFARLRLPPGTVGIDTLKRSLSEGWAPVRNTWKLPRRRRRRAR
jgi:hypothetical protein